jgi:hypothetical protein
VSDLRKDGDEETDLKECMETHLSGLVLELLLLLVRDPSILLCCRQRLEDVLQCIGYSIRQVSSCEGLSQYGTHQIERWTRSR